MHLVPSLVGKTLKIMVVFEEIHIEDYDMRRHRMKTMECEDIVVS